MLKKTATLIICLFCVTSCGSKDDELLEIATTSNKAFLIDATSSSCKAIREADGAPAEDISGKYFSVRGLKFIWKHEKNRLDIALIKLKFKSRNLKADYTCQIGGDELLALSTGWDGSIDASGGYHRRTEKTTDCDLKCGGVSTEEKSFSANGTIEVIGYMTEPNGDQAPVKHTTSFAIENVN